MLDQIKSVLGLSDTKIEEKQTLNKRLAAAALLVHIIAVDGKIKPEEEEKLHAILSEHYAVSVDDARDLEDMARSAQSEAVDLYAFTSVLKAEMTEQERLALVEDLWELVFADGQMHEFEDNVVWRVAELIGIQSRERMLLKQRVQARNTPKNV